jgi:hypothetical protein
MSDRSTRLSIPILVVQVLLVVGALVGIAVEADTAALGCALLCVFVSALPSARRRSCGTASD